MEKKPLSVAREAVNPQPSPMVVRRLSPDSAGVKIQRAQELIKSATSR